MIDNETFLEEISNVTALWCAPSDDGADLARDAARAVEYNMPLVSAVPEDVPMLWTWLEKTDVRIYSRFYLAAHDAADVAAVSGLAARITTAFKHGARGAQVFLPVSDLDDFAAQIGPVRDDLFFNHDFAIGMDISDIDSDQWGHVFDVMTKLRVNALTLALARDGGRRCDFAGRVYAAMSAAENISCDLHFVLGARPIRMEQAARLVRAMRPQCAEHMRIFVPSE